MFLDLGGIFEEMLIWGDDQLVRHASCQGHYLQNVHAYT